MFNTGTHLNHLPGIHLLVLTPLSTLPLRLQLPTQLQMAIHQLLHLGVLAGELLNVLSPLAGATVLNNIPLEFIAFSPRITQWQYLQSGPLECPVLVEIIHLLFCLLWVPRHEILHLLDRLATLLPF